MIPEAAISLLALARIGAIVMPLFSGYGPRAIARRLELAEAAMRNTATGAAVAQIPEPRPRNVTQLPEPTCQS